MPQKINTNQHRGSKNGVKARKKQMGGRPWVKTFIGCGLAVERKNESIQGFPLNLLWERCPTRLTSYPKEISMGCDHLMHAIEVANKEA